MLIMKPLRKTHSIINIISQRLIDLPAPINISLWWNYGSLLGLFLVVQIIRGIFLSIHYCPNTELAFFSIVHITRNVNWGWIMHSIHINGASFFLMLIYLHMARGIYYSSFYLKETWNIGVTIFMASIITAFMGYVLPWGQISFWGATVITNIFSATPYLGIHLVQWLWGGFAVTNPTLNRFFILHFLMPFIILILIILHLLILHEIGSRNPLGVNSNSDRIPFHLYYTVKDTIGFIVFVLIFILFFLFTPNILNDPENFIEANPLSTPNHIQPEWYFLWLYAILRSIPNKLGGVIALLMAILIIYLPPIYNRPKATIAFYPLNQYIFFVILITWSILRWIGRCPVEYPFIQIGQLSTTIYFLYFLMHPQLILLW